MKLRFVSLIVISLMGVLSAQGVIIQENETGFCSVDGIIDTDVPGYTGDGFANADIAAGTSALWNIECNEDDTYLIYWRYANGGGSGDLIAEVWVNEVPVILDFSFDHTGQWTNWSESDTVALQLESGENRIRLVSVSPSGLANIDFMHVITDGATPAECVPSYALHLSQNIEEAGTVSIEPERLFYDQGTEITLRASENPGYFFQSWSGGTTDTALEHTFQINANADIEALFYPDGTVSAEGVMGYATVQDDAGTPFIMTGGVFGDTVLAFSFSMLKSFLEHPDPFVVTVADKIRASGQINIASDKSLIGITDSAHLEGIRIKINSSDNVIIRNMTFSKVVQFDEIEINNSHHIWIDSCEFFTDRDNGPEFYDGLLDIKNGSTFITVSNTEFHDHFKSVLISSGDDSFQDTVVRITFFRNYFHNLGSRTPLLRFGKAHIFNNYFRKCTSGINSRMGACIRVEENYFRRVGNAVRSDMSAQVGFFQLANNIFDKSSYIPPPECEMELPYEYESLMIDAENVPLAVAGEDPSTSTQELSELSVKAYPNPSTNHLLLEINGQSQTSVSLRIYDQLGRPIMSMANQYLYPGSNTIEIPITDLPSGNYYLELINVGGVKSLPFIKL